MGGVGKGAFYCVGGFQSEVQLLAGARGEWEGPGWFGERVAIGVGGDGIPTRGQVGNFEVTIERGGGGEFPALALSDEPGVGDGGIPGAVGDDAAADGGGGLAGEVTAGVGEVFGVVFGGPAGGAHAIAQLPFGGSAGEDQNLLAVAIGGTGTHALAEHQLDRDLLDIGREPPVEFAEAEADCAGDAFPGVLAGLEATFNDFAEEDDGVALDAVADGARIT